VVIEHVRNVLGFEGAGNQEFDRDAEHLAITELACSLAGREDVVRFVEGSFLAACYGATESIEPFRCSYGLNDDFRLQLEDAGLVVSALGDEGEARAVELRGHPFFVAVLYVPQAQSRDEPHPLIRSFVGAAS
jgi:CTP synthase (UTP-ammonia lyase)